MKRMYLNKDEMKIQVWSQDNECSRRLSELGKWTQDPPSSAQETP